ncbi:ferredoxin--NADP reductase [Nocardia cerradoensis]|uniref:ferredoxin--NADP reductase n=1 Tax=Nocardia cerradoensis TaxID=85688 RepID=UPI000585860C|nr:ferredoxin--NADP reductase [Nocardia cerradoensis]NKY42669.1 ferredoxin--NADP reductase [Nocardia cerradoensis]
MASPPMFRPATVTRIVKECADARTFVLAPHDGPLTYRAGQFCTFRVRVNGTELYRSYSMSSAPETDAELMTTVKRVPGGKVSNWLLDNVSEGDEIDMGRPAGRFCLRDTEVPLLGFSGGSGITPVLSLAKSALATTARQVRLLCADRDADSVIFGTTLLELAERYRGRLQVVRHLDNAAGLLHPAAVREFVGADGHADSYVCGPETFMEMVEGALPGPGMIFSERFGAPVPELADSAIAPVPVTTPETATPATESGTAGGTVTIFLNRKKATVQRHAGETLLESARRAGLTPPFSCESGNCATCMARLSEGSATMRVNDALADDEVEDGYVLTCQAVPDTESVTVHYE